MLLQREFGLIWWSQFIAQIGDGVTKLALIWFVYAVTGSPLKATIVIVLQTIPPILLGPFIGVLVDRVAKKPLLIGSDLLRACLIGLIPCWLSPDAFTVEALYLLVVGNAVATAVFGPALFGAVPLVVERRQLTAADALLQGTTSIGVIGGPALSGVGIALLGSQEVLCLNAGTYVASALCLLFVRLPRVPAAASQPTRACRSPLRDLADGIRFVVRGEPLILLLVLTAGLYSFAVSAFHTLLPVFGKTMLRLGPLEIGYLTSAMGVGLLGASLGLVWISGWSLWRRIHLLTVSSLLSATALWSLLGVSDGGLAAGLILLIGAGNGVLTPVEWGILQEVTPPELIGRVLGLYGTGAMLAAITGMLTLGWVTEQWGSPAGLTGIAAMLMLTALVANRVAEYARARDPASVARNGYPALYDSPPRRP